MHPIWRTRFGGAEVPSKISLMNLERTVIVRIFMVLEYECHEPKLIFSSQSRKFQQYVLNVTHCLWLHVLQQNCEMMYEFLHNLIYIEVLGLGRQRSPNPQKAAWSWVRCSLTVASLTISRYSYLRSNLLRDYTPYTEWVARILSRCYGRDNCDNYENCDNCDISFRCRTFGTQYVSFFMKFFSINLDKLCTKRH